METPWTEVAVPGPAVARRSDLRSRRQLLVLPILVTVAVLCAPACGTQPASGPPSAAPPNQVVGWRTLGSWSGRGSTQTESFIVQASLVRVRWETKNEPFTGTGTFRLTYHSAVSGRQLAVVADYRGPGKGEAYIPEEPRPAYMFVESDRLDWSFTVEEGEAGTVGPGGGAAARSARD